MKTLLILLSVSTFTLANHTCGKYPEGSAIERKCIKSYYTTTQDDIKECAYETVINSDGSLNKTEAKKDCIKWYKDNGYTITK